ncbi:hypothetical protein [Paraburkholderia xenovorans]
MIITGHMNYFEVNKCGLYRQNSLTPKGIDLAETFNLITKWVHGKPLANTLPWNPQSGLARCYCKDIYTSEETGDILLVLWKSDTSSNGSILGAPEDAKTGEGNVVEYTGDYKGKKVIWGRPMYYWIIPSKKMVVSIKFEHSVCDTQLFQEWVAACISNRVDHPNKKREYTKSGQTRISFTDGTVNGDFRFRYQFDVSLKTEDTASATMTALASSITHIIKRETISIVPSDERAQWVRLFDNIPFIKPAANAKTRQIEVKVEAKPTPAELKQIIESYTKENRRAGQWDNVGFSTGDQIIWVDRYRLRNSIAYDMPKEQVITAVDLGEAINSRRNNFLKPRLGNSQIVTVAKTGTTT